MLSDASLAQLVEQLTLNQRVTGSSPAGGTLSPCDISRGLFLFRIISEFISVCGKFCSMLRVAALDFISMFIATITFQER